MRLTCCDLYDAPLLVKSRTFSEVCNCELAGQADSTVSHVALLVITGAFIIGLFLSPAALGALSPADVQG